MIYPSERNMKIILYKVGGYREKYDARNQRKEFLSCIHHRFLRKSLIFDAISKVPQITTVEEWRHLPQYRYLGVQTNEGLEIIHHPQPVLAYLNTTTICDSYHTYQNSVQSWHDL